MADKLRKFRKDSYVEERFGKDINVSTKEDAPPKKDMSAAETKSVEKAKPASGAAKPTSFAAAFRAAREAGQKTFKWAGKPGMSFTTEMAGEKKAAPAPARRSPPAATTRTNTSAPTSKAVAATPTSAPKPTTKSDVVKRPQDTARMGSQSLGLRPANFAPVSEERRKQIEEAQKRGYAKGGSARSVDGIAKRGKTRAPMKRK